MSVGALTKYFRLAEVPTRVPHNPDRPPNPATVWRWIKQGVLVNGARVRLAAVRLGGLWMVSEEALKDFLTALSSRPECRPAAPPPRSPAQRRRQSERAAEQLAAAGI